MNSFCSRFAKSLLFFTLLGASASDALAQQKAASARKSFPPQPAQPAAPGGPVVTESLSGIDLIPNRKTGQFGVRINHRINKPATFRLIDTQTSRILRTDLLEPSPYPTRALQVGRLASGEYKMEVVLTDTVYWKTVKVSR
jgi:hypothetical protein